jgi:hypothetical protein
MISLKFFPNLPNSLMLAIVGLLILELKKRSGFTTVLQRYHIMEIIFALFIVTASTQIRDYVLIPYQYKPNFLLMNKCVRLATLPRCQFGDMRLS